MLVTLARSITLVSCAITIAACQTHQPITDKSVSDAIGDKVNIEPQWQTQANQAAAVVNDGTVNGDTTTTAFGGYDWLAQFDDEALDTFVEKALQNNPDLQASAANLAASIAAAKVAGAPLWPQFSAKLDRVRTQSDVSGEANSASNNNNAAQIRYGSVYNGSININWEIDIWGKLSAQKKAAALDAQSQRATFAAARLSLVANVARAWYNINAIDLRLALAEKRLQSQTDTLTVIEEKYKSGLRTALEVYLNRTDLASQQASITDLRDQRDQAIRTFKRLLGEYPNSELNIAARLPELKHAVPAGLPSELLTRRPDILASMRQWQSSKLTAKAADRARFPSFSLTASYGASSETLRLLDEETLLWNLINNLTLPLFLGGQLKAQAQQAEYLADASLNQYLSTLLNSFNEVETALSSERYLNKQAKAIGEAAYYSESGYELAFDQYQSGLIEYTTLLESQRRWFDAQSNLINLKNTLLQNRIALYLALGGDFIASDQTNQPLTAK